MKFNTNKLINRNVQNIMFHESGVITKTERCVLKPEDVVQQYDLLSGDENRELS